MIKIGFRLAVADTKIGHCTRAEHCLQLLRMEENVVTPQHDRTTHNKSALTDKNSYSCFRALSPDCTLHTVITHAISVLERWSLKQDYAIGIHVRLQPSNTVIP